MIGIHAGHQATDMVPSLKASIYQFSGLLPNIQHASKIQSQLISNSNVYFSVFKFFASKMLKPMLRRLLYERLTYIPYT